VDSLRHDRGQLWLQLAQEEVRAMRAKLEESAAALEAAELDARRLQCSNALHEMRDFVRTARDADELDPAVRTPPCPLHLRRLVLRL
jgi:hypothetical protein